MECICVTAKQNSKHQANLEKANDRELPKLRPTYNTAAPKKLTLHTAVPNGHINNNNEMNQIGN